MEKLSDLGDVGDNGWGFGKGGAEEEFSSAYAVDLKRLLGGDWVYPDEGVL